MARRLVLALKDPDRENEFRPLRMKDGRLLVRLVNDPTDNEAGTPSRRALLPAEDTLVLMASESESDEKLEAVKGTDSILEFAIVGGLEGVTGFMDHHERHEGGGADELVKVTVIEDPGSDDDLVSAQAVREAITAKVIAPGRATWGEFLAISGLC